MTRACAAQVKATLVQAAVPVRTAAVAAAAAAAAAAERCWQVALAKDPSGSAVGAGSTPSIVQVRACGDDDDDGDNTTRRAALT